METNMSEKTALLDNLIEKYGCDAAAFIPSANFTWLTGQSKHLMERPTTLLYRPGKKAALVIAGLAAHGITYVEDIKYIHRGYENFEGKITALGGKILMTEFIGDVDIEAPVKVLS